MPMMRTKAPTGYARTPYSVSPRRKLHSFGPMNKKNWVAFMPVHRAVLKWPSSCKKIEISSPMTKTNAHGLHMYSATSSTAMMPKPMNAVGPPAVGSRSGLSAPPAITSLRNLVYVSLTLQEPP